MRRIISAIGLLSIFFTAGGQSIHKFGYDTQNFLLDGKPFQIISGEMHPARIPRQYWRQRIQMARAMGCNTISVYVFWNYHETKEGIFDFKSANHDIAAFMHICQQEGMWVLLRAGPYSCGEWDFGGLPSYLLKIPDIKVRCMDPRYMAAVSRYIRRLSKEVVGLQCTRGGPIIMLQIENEYGSYGNDRQYLQELRRLWVQNGINIPFYTADGATPYMLEAGTLPGAAVGLDPGIKVEDFKLAEELNPSVPVFSSETYPGWFTRWGGPWARPDTNKIKSEVSYLLDHNKSFSLYMVHGGTNFGYTAGAGARSSVQFQPVVTSYDFDAPIDEQGNPTAKFFMLRRLIQEHVQYKIPGIPPQVPTIGIPAIALRKIYNLWNYRLHSLWSVQPRPIEDYDQNQGLILYKTTLIGRKSGELVIWEPHDLALIFLDGKFIDTVGRDGGHWEVDLPETNTRNPVLEILVEAMGHVKIGQFILDRKGITDRVTLNGMTLMNWQTTLFPMDELFIKTEKPDLSLKIDDKKPCNFFRGIFTLSNPGDTYFDLSGYSKGVVFVNGHNLGRFWSIGPEQRLYCPAGWLKRGNNTILVFDLLGNKAASVSGHHRKEGN